MFAATCRDWVQGWLRGRRLREARRASLRRRHGRWAVIEPLEARRLLSAAIVSFELANDTGTPGDHVTTDAVVSGTVSDPQTLAYLEFDFDGDGVADTQDGTSPEGEFTVYADSYVMYGPVTVSARTVEYGEAAMIQYGGWVSLSFTYEPPPPPQVTALALLNDTDTPADGITTDATLTGAVETDPFSCVTVEFDFDDDGLTDASTVSNMDGSFTFDAGTYLPYGLVTVKARAMAYADDAFELTGDWVSLTFRYQSPNRAPIITSFAAVEGPDNVWYFQGTIDDEHPQFVTIAFGGVMEGFSVTVEADGSFCLGKELTPDQAGQVTAQATDEYGLSSELAEYLVYWG